MGINEKKARVLAFVSAVGLMVIGCETITPIDVEVVPKQEPAWRSEITALTVELQKKRLSIKLPNGDLFQKGEVLRGVHPKSHGCVEADFIINKDIGSEYRVGLFAYPGKHYKAKIRYSNAAVLILPDLDKNKNGSRGMAIKVLGVGDPIMFEDGSAKNQDFLMINTPEFAFRNVRDYRRLSRALNADKNGASPDLFFLPAKLAKLGKPTENEPPEVTVTRRKLDKIFKTSAVFEGFSPEDMAGTIRSLRVVGKIRSKTVRNPLQVQYFSASPFRYGPDRVMKFSVGPQGGEVPQSKFSPEEMKNLDPDYLALALKKTMTQGKTIHLSFKVQVVNASQLKGHEKEMIENASKEWPAEKYPFVEVARIEIHPVKENKNLVDACKPLLFTPWHALKAHEPLGGINRLRKPVYNKSAECRRNAAGNAKQGPCSRAERN